MGRAVITRMGRRYRFFIPEVNDSDTGSYTMEVNAESGIVKKQFKINVEGECKVYLDADVSSFVSMYSFTLSVITFHF